jgi:hypothetical protein
MRFAPNEAARSATYLSFLRATLCKLGETLCPLDYFATPKPRLTNRKPNTPILTYLRLSQCRIGLLLNFNTVSLKDGIRRRIN